MRLIIPYLMIHNNNILVVSFPISDTNYLYNPMEESTSLVEQPLRKPYRVSKPLFTCKISIVLM